MLLRQAVMADLPELVDVQQAGAEVGLAHIFPQDTYPFPRASVLERWAEEVASPEIDVFVVVQQRAIDGFAAVRDNELLHFGTALRTWGTGLAAVVHHEVLERLAAAGKPGAWLRVFEQNHRARRFYEKMGWTPTERRTRSAFVPFPVLIDYEIAFAGNAVRSDRKPTKLW